MQTAAGLRPRRFGASKASPLSPGEGGDFLLTRGGSRTILIIPTGQYQPPGRLQTGLFLARLTSGAFVCSCSGALTGGIGDSIIGYPGNLARS